MFTGKTKEALEIIKDKDRKGVLKLNDHLPSEHGNKCVRDVLIEKHPAGHPPDPVSLTYSHSLLPTHLVYYSTRLMLL